MPFGIIRTILIYAFPALVQLAANWLAVLLLIRRSLAHRPDGILERELFELPEHSELEF